MPGTTSGSGRAVLSRRVTGSRRHATHHGLVLVASLAAFAASACAAHAPQPPSKAPTVPPSAWSLDQQPVPQTLDDALHTLERGLGTETIARLYQREEEDIAIRLVPTLGRWMEEHWGLATGSPLAGYFEQLGVDRPDDMAAVILTSFWRKLHFRQIRLDEQIAWYKAVREPRK